MIRSIWGYSVATLATLFFGSIVFIASLLRIRGRIYYQVARRWSQTLLWAAGCEVRVHGFDRVQWGRPYIIVSNHVSAFDVLAIAVTSPVPFHFVAKKELERVPVFGPAWKLAGHISIDRDNRQKAIASLRKAAEVVEEDGGVVVIFPEGTRSATGELQPFKKGAFALALETGIPILPVVVVGSERIMPKGSLLIHPEVMHLHLGEPLDVTEFPGEVDQLVDRVWHRMAEMLAAARNQPRS